MKNNNNSHRLKVIQTDAQRFQCAGFCPVQVARVSRTVVVMDDCYCEILLSNLQIKQNGDL